MTLCVYNPPRPKALGVWNPPSATAPASPPYLGKYFQILGKVGIKVVNEAATLVNVGLKV